MKVGETIHGYELTERIEKGGSDRHFFRCLKNDKPYIMIHDPEMKAHLQLQQHLSSNQIPVPEVYWYDLGANIMVEEDLGPASLYEMQMAQDTLHTIYRQAIDVLVHLQIDARPGVPVQCYYDAEHIRWEQEYFCDCFLRQYCGLTRESFSKIDEDLRRLGSRLLESAQPVNDYLMHRDFQSQNIFYKDDRIRIIDFQSARIGPLTYDLAALLRDAYMNIEEQTENGLFEYYYYRLRERGIAIGQTDLLNIYRLTALQRNMQALGAFANLSLNRDKPHFRRYIPRGLHLLRQLSRETEFTKLHAVVKSIDV
jgi:aminoglycoside/choline kinase family phosphotransferase